MSLFLAAFAFSNATFYPRIWWFWVGVATVPTLSLAEAMWTITRRKNAVWRKAEELSAA